MREISCWLKENQLELKGPWPHVEIGLTFSRYIVAFTMWCGPFECRGNFPSISMRFLSSMCLWLKEGVHEHSLVMCRVIKRRESSVDFLIVLGVCSIEEFHFWFELSSVTYIIHAQMNDQVVLVSNRGLYFGETGQIWWNDKGISLVVKGNWKFGYEGTEFHCAEWVSNS